MRLQFLDCADAFGSGGRFNPCIHVTTGSTRFLVDCPTWQVGHTPFAAVCSPQPRRCDLALSPLHLELMRRRGAAGRAWARHLPRNRTALLKFGPAIARRRRRRRPRPSDRWHLDEMVVRIAGQQMYLWRAVDHEGEVIDKLVQRQRDTRAALRL